MCWICEAYGDPEIENGRWYLNPENHARHMYKVKRPGQKSSAYGSDPESQSAETFFEIIETRFQDTEKFKKLVKDANEMKGEGPFQIGQVVPLKEAKRIAEYSYPIASMSCLCRLAGRAEEEQNEHEYSCTGLGAGMLKWERWPERYKGGVNFMSADEAKEWLEKWDRKGMVHIIMTFGGSYVGGLCNCSYPTCMNMRSRLDYGVETMCIKSHWVASINYDLCNGCGVCAQRCQFGAVKFEVTQGKANIDQFACYGCGLCETGCPRGAIELVDRESLPGLKEVW